MAEVVNYKDIGSDMEKLIKDFKDATKNTDDILWRRDMRDILIGELDALGNKAIEEAVEEYSPGTDKFKVLLKSLADFKEKLRKIADTVEKADKVIGWLAKFAKYAAILV